MKTKSASKQTPPTKTIGYRWPSSVVDKIKETAKERKLTVGDYILTQLSPSSEVMHFIITEEEKMLTKSKAIADIRDKMREDFERMVEATGLPEDEVFKAITQAVKVAIKGDDNDKETE